MSPPRPRLSARAASQQTSLNQEQSWSGVLTDCAEQAVGGLAEALGVAEELVQPGGALVAEGHRQRLLPVRAPRHHQLRLVPAQPADHRQELRDRVEDGAVRAAQVEEAAHRNVVLLPVDARFGRCVVIAARIRASEKGCKR